MVCSGKVRLDTLIIPPHAKTRIHLDFKKQSRSGHQGRQTGCSTPLGEEALTTVFAGLPSMCVSWRREGAAHSESKCRIPNTMQTVSTVLKDPEYPNIESMAQPLKIKQTHLSPPYLLTMRKLVAVVADSPRC